MLERLNKIRLLYVVLAVLLLVGLLLATYGHAQTNDFTIVVLPDTQYYAASYPSIFNSQMQWIVNNASALNIKLVLGLDLPVIR